MLLPEARKCLRESTHALVRGEEAEEIVWRERSANADDLMVVVDAIGAGQNRSGKRNVELIP